MIGGRSQYEQMDSWTEMKDAHQSSGAPPTTPQFNVPKIETSGHHNASDFSFQNDISPDSNYSYAPTLVYANDYSNEYSSNIPGVDNKRSKFARNDTDQASSLDGRVDDSQKPTGYYSQRSAFTHFLRDWWLELVACFFLFGSLVAIIVAAHEYQDHPLPNLPKGLTLNSIFSIFVVVLKAAMLLILAQGLSHLKWTWFARTRPLNDLARYDQASRGPLGSIWLLCTLRGRDAIASIGALLVIAHIVLDPMAQQVIRYYNCQRVQPALTAALPRTNAYMEQGLHLGAGTSTVSTAMQSAINGGVFNPGAQVTYDCPSGNCTFPAAAYTIGMQSVCQDVSNELVFQNVSSADNLTTSMNATLPSGLFASYSNYPFNNIYMAMAFNSSLNDSVEIILSPKFADPDTPRDLCTGSLYENLTNKDTNWICRGWGAARCMMRPVVYEIQNGTIRAGTLMEDLKLAVPIDSQHASISATPGVADMSCVSDAQKSMLRDQGYDVPASLKWLAYNTTLDADGNFVAASDNNDDSSSSSSATYNPAHGGSVASDTTTTTTTTTNTTTNIVPSHCIYGIWSPSMLSLYYFFNTYFQGNIVPDGSQFTGSSVAQQFYNVGGITFDTVDQIFANISASMTTYIRQHGSANNSAPAPGQVWEVDTCVRIRWGYVAFPIAMTVLTLLFFVGMIVTTSRGQQGVHHDFKSSPLALLFHGLDEDAVRRVEGLNRASQSNEVENLTEEAKGMMVRLRSTTRGWRFVVDEDYKTRVQ